MQTQKLLDEVEQREAAFWDEAARATGDHHLKVNTEELGPEAQYRKSLLGSLAGKRVLDVGCGTGLWSVLLAQQGAEVWAIDISPESIAVTRRRVEINGVGPLVHTAVMSATSLDFPDKSFDVVHGKDILHHLDASLFGREISRVLDTSGRAVFSENSSNNKILMFARDHLCGRFGIAKWSSDDEYPLSKKRIGAFSKFFLESKVLYPEFLFFHYLNAKSFCYRNPLVNRICNGLDQCIFKYARALRKYSYRQIVCCNYPVIHTSS